MPEIEEVEKIYESLKEKVNNLANGNPQAKFLKNSLFELLNIKSKVQKTFDKAEDNLK